MRDINSQDLAVEPVDIQQESSLVVSIVNILSYLFFPIQCFISITLDVLLISWFSWIFKYFLGKDGDQQEGNTITYVLDKRNITHQVIYIYLFKIVYPLKSFFAGTKTGSKLYEHLIASNKNIIFRGIERSDVSVIITLYKKHQPEPGKFIQIEDFAVLASTKFVGQFKIIDKKIVKDEILIRCIWISGKSRGKVFEVSPSLFYKNDKMCPDYFYQFPVWLKYTFELFLIISSLIAILKISGDGWEYIYEWMGRLGSYLSL